jgi:hypothetical protein
MTTFLTTNGAPHVRDSWVPPSDTAAEPACRQTYWAVIDRSDNALLDFDAERLEHDDIDHARALLVQHPTTYKNHLTIARFLEGWAARIANDARFSEFNDGFVEALREVVDHLRDGDFAVEPGEDVEDEDQSPTTDVASSRGALSDRGRPHQPRRIVLTPADLSSRAAVSWRTRTGTAPSRGHDVRMVGLRAE